MALQRMTIVDQIEITSIGDMQIRFLLMVVDGDNVVAKKFHRTAIPADIPPGLQMQAVNTHLAAMGESPVSVEDIARITAHHDLEKTTAGRKADAVRLFRKPV